MSAVVYTNTWTPDFGKEIVKNPMWATIPHHTWSTDVSLACSIAADIIIAATMSIILHRRSTEFDRTRSIVHKMIAYSVGTGFLTVIISLLTLVFVRSFSEFHWLALYLTT
jgi:hypothetical protein